MIINNAVLTGSFIVNGVNYITNTPTTGSNTFVGTQTTSGSVIITGSLQVTGSIATTGTITAQTLVVQTVTSSIVYSSGSNIFGNQLTDVQQMTGSLRVTGSLSLNNTAIPTSASLASTYLPLAGGTLTGALSGTSATFKVNADRNLAIKYDTNVILSSQGDSGGPESLRVFADTFRIFTATSAAGLTERFTISNAGAATFSSSVTVGGNTTVQSGSVLSVYRTDNTRAIQLYTTNDECVLNSWEASSEPLHIRSMGSGGRIQFFTSGSEKMRITSTGYLKATSTGTYNDLNAANFEFVNGTVNANSFFVGNTNTSYAGATLVRINGSRTTTNASYNLIGATNGNSTGEFLVRDSGNCQNTNNSYTGTSDIKLKQDIIDATSQWEDIKQMRIRKFRFKKQVEQDENAPYLLGVIAQELELISPNLVDEALDFDGTDKEVTTTTKSVKYSIIYMKAVKALQEAMAKIETLEARLTALENK